MPNQMGLRSGGTVFVMDKLLQLVVKLNNLIGFLPNNLNQIFATVTSELSTLFAPYEVRFYLSDLEAEKKELSWLIAEGIISAKYDCKAVREGLPLIIEGNGLEPSCRGCSNEKGAGHVCIPIVAGRQVLGSLVMTTDVARPLNRDELEVVISVVNQVTVAIQRNRLLQNLQSEKEMLIKANQEILSLNQDLIANVLHLQTTQGQLIHSEKLAAAGRLAANIAHEINNPTGIILSRIDCILLEMEEDPQLVIDLEVIRRQAQRIAGITKGLVSFTRKPGSVREKIDLAKLLSETLGWLDNQLTKQAIVVKLQLQKVPFIRGISDQLQQVIVNLLSNAKDAMPEGGMITIDLYQNIPTQQVILEIADTGCGIPDTEIDKVFEPFYTSKGPGVGTGLGLFITYTIIEEHDAKISVESEPGRGTKFVLKFTV